MSKLLTLFILLWSAGGASSVIWFLKRNPGILLAWQIVVLFFFSALFGPVFWFEARYFDKEAR